MCDVGNIILNSVLTFASVWIVRKFLDTFYEKKRWNVLSVSVWLIYIIFQGYVQFHSGDASVVTTIVNVLLCIMISAQHQIFDCQREWNTVSFKNFYTGRTAGKSV